MDLSELLVPFGDETPSGPNLEYEPVFREMEEAATPGEDRSVDHSNPKKPREVVTVIDPNYREVRSKALEILGKSHDLRAAIHLGNASLMREGLPEFAACITYIADCLETYWDTCHPELDEDDGDATMRINALSALVDTRTTLRAARLVGLCKSPNFGSPNLRMIEIADGDIEAEDQEQGLLDMAAISAAFRDTPEEAMSDIYEAVTRVIADLGRIDAVFNEKTPGEGPRLNALTALMRRMADRMKKEVGTLGVETAEPDETDDEATVTEGTDATGGGAAASAAKPQALSGEITSSADVRKAIEKIIEYYARNEPSSPVPLLLERANRLVGADFLTVVRDLAPAGVESVQSVGGIEES